MALNQVYLQKIARWGWLPSVTILALVVVLYLWLLADLPPLDAIEQRMVRPTTQILDRNGRLLYEVIDPDAGKQINLDLRALPAACVQATLATEDSRFYLHPGVDPIAIARATWQNFRAGGEIVSGASTLTQQLARTLLLSTRERYQQSIRRKLREAWLAWRLEQRYTKDELLALYLNQTYYGNFAFGIEAAAQIFFAKPATQLSRAECALLAGLVQYPVGYNPLQDPESAKLRQLTVLRLMEQAGFVTAAERDQIAAEPLRYRSRLFNIQAPHFVIYVQDLLARQLGPDVLRAGGLRVVTTLDLDLQRQAEETIRYRLDLLNCRRPGLCDNNTNPNRQVENAAAIVIDSRTGAILAMVGSPDYFDARRQGNVNAALALRQPGSAIKPLTYAAALDPTWSAEAGVHPLTPASILADLPATFYVLDRPTTGLTPSDPSNGQEVSPVQTTGGKVPYTPVNYDRTFHGPVSVRSALANSYNIPAVKVLDRIGVPTLQRLAARAGISTFANDFGLALTLGGGEVKLLELTAAYGIFLDGKRRDPQAIINVHSDATGIWNLAREATSHVPRPTPVISAATAHLITDILSDRVARIPAFGEGSPLDLPFPAAVKTGTTTDWRDNWAIGYTTERIVGVWVGNADNTPMLDVSGIDGAGPIWHDLMLAAHPTPPAPFVKPDGIVEELICAPSGLLPTAACPRTRLERFVRGTEPTDPDNQFQIAKIDRTTGQPASASTASEQIVERTFWLLPPEFHGWMAAQGIPIVECGLWDTGCRMQDTGCGMENTDCFAVDSESDVKQAELEPTDIGAIVGQHLSHSALVLAAPTSNTGYQIHPGVPRANQQIEVTGYASGGQPWAELRLVKDGDVLAEGVSLVRLSTWWTLEEGEHYFWLEGRLAEGGEQVTSSRALVVVDPFHASTMSGDETRASAAPALE
jgi:penicillin-binding protein 1C